MSRADEPTVPPSGEASLADLLDELTGRIQAGELIDWDAILQAHPDHAGELRLLLPTLGALVLPGTVGGCRILRLLGKGGMGVVYEAEQIGLKRRVALKMILAGEFASPAEVHRFRFEAEAVAALDHPNIVPIYEVGEDDGRHFFVMKLIEGESLAERLRRLGPLAPREAACLVGQVARAVHHAHQRGVLHRDLKPANILLDATGAPHVTDFGLARRLDADQSLNPSGTIAGTLSYMAPEQARGEKGLTTRADVWALGAILYQCLTGRPPFEGTVPETLRQVLEKEPVPPGRLNPRVDRRLEAICLKCLRKAPASRYGSAEELAADLDNYVHNRRVIACSLSLLDTMASVFNSEHDIVEFAGPMGRLLLWYAPFVLVWSWCVFWVIETRQPGPVVWGLFFLGYLPLFAIYRRHTTDRATPAGVAERHMWALWIGHVLGVVTLAATAPPGLEPAEQLLRIYPAYTILMGLTFFIEGSLFWGRHYAIGLAYFALAPLMMLRLEWAPLEHGLLGAFVSLAIGLTLRRLPQKRGPQ
jgi:serine/threonine-protein kinase